MDTIEYRILPHPFHLSSNQGQQKTVPPGQDDLLGIRADRTHPQNPISTCSNWPFVSYCHHSCSLFRTLVLEFVPG